MSNKDTLTKESAQIGSVVTLKSGGPQMTVIGMGDDTVSCTWFDKSEKSVGKDFPYAALVLGTVGLEIHIIDQYGNASKAGPPPLPGEQL